MKIISLGEGNFTFSLALVNNLEEFGILFDTLVVSSFDSSESLGKKYPETSSIIKKLQNIPNVKVCHDIDATKLLTLQHNNDSPDCNISASFDHIIFNFPHLGVEDCQLHSSLLAHFFHNIIPSLQPHGYVYISLTNAQATRWKLIEMATRNHMKLVQSLPLYEYVWKGYELKRHQKGKSFRTRIQHDICMTYCFQQLSDYNESKLNSNMIYDSCDPNQEINNNHFNLFEKVYNCYNQENILNNTPYLNTTNHVNVNVDINNDSKYNCDVNTKGIHDNTSKNISKIFKQKRGKRRKKIDEITSGKYIQLTEYDIYIQSHPFNSNHTHIGEDITTTSSSSSNNSSDTKMIALDPLEERRMKHSLLWRCQSCQKIFHTLQGVQTHIYTQHTLTTTTLSSSINTDSSKSDDGYDDRNYHQDDDIAINSMLSDSIRVDDGTTKIMTTISTTSTANTATTTCNDKNDTLNKSRHTDSLHFNMNDNNVNLNTKELQTCSICQKTFTSKKALVLHHTAKHSDTPSPHPTRPPLYSNDHHIYNISSSSSNNNNNTILVHFGERDDTICESDIPDNDIHIDIITPITSLNKYSTAQSDVLNTAASSDIYNIQQSHQEQYECNICGRMYETQYQLDLHTTKLVDFKPKDNTYDYKCSQCNKVFHDQRALIQHQNYKHHIS